MHVHIVYCHPSEQSLTAEIRDAFIRGLENSGKTHTISELYKQNFKTDMTEEEYLRDAFYNAEPPLAPDVLAEQALINAADALVFIYPVFWTEAPAKLVGWFSRVWSFGFAYGVAGDLEGTPENPRVKPMKTLDKALVIACAGNTKEALEEQGRLQAMENVMLGDRIYDRALHKEFVLLGGTERNNATLRVQMEEQHLKTAYQLGCEL
ncbi:MAG: NAD(P)H-dependent oxidoreductase [Coriobacteriia bacterium]|nr:NAD(P)H-dependent oxidoreductase [Coriobacteriia bacterium]MCL2750611.1 NAD(P)H-dependent oxidoreductase [Coriobacteriia bacterium]